MGGVIFYARGDTPGPSSPVAAARGTCPRDMAYIEAGSYWLGDVKRLAHVAPLCIDLSEVSAGAYATCVEHHECSDDQVTSCAPSTYRATERRSYAMNCVDFRQADAFCRARGHRLPTEDEWEWVARGGKLTFGFPWGNDAPSDQLCWSGMTKRTAPCPIGQFDKGDTADHVQDLAGGMVEWTQSFYGDGEEFRVYRGGSWADEQASVVRSSSRHQAAPTKRGELLGFRCVATPTSSPH